MPELRGEPQLGEAERRRLVLGRLGGVCDADGYDDALVVRDETESAVTLHQNSRGDHVCCSLAC